MKSIYILTLFIYLCLSAQSQVVDSSAIRLEIDHLISQSDSLQKDKKLDEALNFLEQAHEKCLETFGNQTLLHAKICSKKGLIYHYKKEPIEAEAMANESMAFFITNEEHIKDQAYHDSY